MHLCVCSLGWGLPLSPVLFSLLSPPASINFLPSCYLPCIWGVGWIHRYPCDTCTFPPVGQTVALEWGCSLGASVCGKDICREKPSLLSFYAYKDLFPPWRMILSLESAPAICTVQTQVSPSHLL